MPPISRFLVPNHGPDNDNLRVALIAGRDMCNATGASKLTLVTSRMDIDTTDCGTPFHPRLTL